MTPEETADQQNHMANLNEPVSIAMSIGPEPPPIDDAYVDGVGDAYVDGLDDAYLDNHIDNLEPPQSQFTDANHYPEVSPEDTINQQIDVGSLNGSSAGGGDAAGGEIGKDFEKGGDKTTVSTALDQLDEITLNQNFNVKSDHLKLFESVTNNLLKDYDDADETISFEFFKGKMGHAGIDLNDKGLYSHLKQMFSGGDISLRSFCEKLPVALEKGPARAIDKPGNDAKRNGKINEGGTATQAEGPDDPENPDNNNDSVEHEAAPAGGGGGGTNIDFGMARFARFVAGANRNRKIKKQEAIFSNSSEATLKQACDSLSACTQNIDQSLSSYKAPGASLADRKVNAQKILNSFNEGNKALDDFGAMVANPKMRATLTPEKLKGFERSLDKFRESVDSIDPKKNDISIFKGLENGKSELKNKMSDLSNVIADLIRAFSQKLGFGIKR